ncbi:MAG: hypothetical protein KVP17_001018 [Porospora cf. gigantea B]|uniref:uncharacterized protein n=1 Tax=Porospora cf. gigantea B TaxID=2853592 RepID=UPI0035718B11|nr:MAG: hypothetical protein KVP17_001018 [Porospora cf. gigantea B]
MKHPEKDVPNNLDKPQQSERTQEMMKAFENHGSRVRVKGLKRRLSRILRTKNFRDCKDTPASADATWEDMSPKRLEAVCRESNVLSLSESPISILPSDSAPDTS